MFRYPTAHSRPCNLTSEILALSVVENIVISGRYATSLGTVRSSYLGWACVGGIGGVNPGTPAYVGYLCIILRRQKHTSRYICITPLLVKLAYCPAAKKIMVDTYVSFFRQEPSTCAPVRACARAVLRRSELFLPCFQNFFFMSSVYSVPSQLLARICRLVIATLTPPPPLSRCHCQRHVTDAFTLTPPPPLSPPRQRRANRCLSGCCAIVIVLVLLL